MKGCGDSSELRREAWHSTIATYVHADDTDDEAMAAVAGTLIR
jgi:hypothetical protein